MATTNAPTPLSNTPVGGGTLVFPGDLLSYVSTPTTGTGSSVAVASGSGYTNSQGGYYSQFAFSPANTVIGAGNFTGAGSSAGFPSFNNNSGNIYLPLPTKINDISLHLWQDASAIDFVPILQSQGVSTIFGFNQQALNPWAYITYKQPLMREFTMQWILASNSPAESQTLTQIVNVFKIAALPDYTNSGATLSYPYIVNCRLNPNAFLFDLKPLCLISVEIDYSGSGHGVSFFNDGSPTIISFTIHMKEIQIITRSDVVARGGTFASGMKSVTT